MRAILRAFRARVHQTRQWFLVLKFKKIYIIQYTYIVYHLPPSTAHYSLTVVKSYRLWMQLYNHTTPIYRYIMFRMYSSDRKSRRNFFYASRILNKINYIRHSTFKNMAIKSGIISHLCIVWCYKWRN